MHLRVFQQKAQQACPPLLTLDQKKALVGRKVLTARIEEIVPAADPGSRAFRGKALLGAAPGLLPGMYARLDVPHGERSVMLLPRERIASVGQLDVAWVQGDGGAARRFLRLGESPDGEHIEVIAGLEEGDRVLLPPTR